MPASIRKSARAAHGVNQNVALLLRNLASLHAAATPPPKFLSGVLYLAVNDSHDGANFRLKN